MCKVCFKEIKNGCYHDFLNSGIICYNCLNALNPEFIEFKIDDVDALAIYEYSDFVKDKIYAYKGCGDFELNNIFVGPFINELRALYFNYEIVPVPSHKKGNHVVYMFSCLGLKINDIFYKSNEHKQSDHSYLERKEVGNYIHLKDEKTSLEGKNILLVDDICTTGSTLKACLKMLKELRPKRIKILVVAKRVFTEEEIENMKKSENYEKLEIV